jgi:hypothetical protein
MAKKLLRGDTAEDNGERHSSFMSADECAFPGVLF